MEQLDAVYTAFSNLEKNYARSKKTREEYLLDKCGGDFDVGPFLILYSLDSAELTDPADIEKLSFIRHTLEKIKETRGSHNQLKSFNFDEVPVETQLLSAIIEGARIGRRVQYADQKSFYEASPQGSFQFHYRCNATGSSVVAAEHCKYFHVHTPLIQAFVKALSNGAFVPEARCIVERKLGDRFEYATDIVF